MLSLAPGEEHTPLCLFQDINSEYLAFPTICCGKTRPDHYSAISKWELRNVDRRVATNIPNIFFKLKRLQIKQIKDKVMLAVRKCKTKGKKMTAHEVLSPGFVDNINNLIEETTWSLLQKKNKTKLEYLIVVS
jgi:hypothetical protein